MRCSYMSVSKHFLENIAYNLRIASILATTKAGSGHPTSALSAADLIAAIFYDSMRFDPQNYANPNNDRFILSKGHAAPVLYAVWKELGVITQKEFLTLRQFDSILEGHPTLRFPQSEAATGSLGQGLSIGVGMALSNLIDENDARVYVLMGDGEISEGSIWEAAQVAAHYHLNNLIGIVDCNRLGQSDATIHGHDVAAYAQKFIAFGFKTFIVDGHDMEDIRNTLEKARQEKQQPVMIIAKTIKGYGVQGVEDTLGHHGKAFAKDNEETILSQLEKRFPQASVKPHETWKPTVPKKGVLLKKEAITILPAPYNQGEFIPTRKAYGKALDAIGDVSEEIIALDGDVKNSTYSQDFEKDHKKRFVQCFIAEQNMVGMGVGLAARHKIPFIATFGAFFTRAFDQIRMAAVGKAPLRLVGSHAGVSIGEDGPSQMALEDIAMMRTLPQGIVLYPSDATCTYKLVELIANRYDGISYIRTTRIATPVLYDSNESFLIGGCKVLRQSENDVACVIAAGVTLYEALKAYDTLQKQNVTIAVIDLYSIKPLDAETVTRVAQKANNRIITVEDHYAQGGIGEAVLSAVQNKGFTTTCLAVKELPRSGKPEELLAWAGIDAQAICSAIISRD